MFNVEDLYKTMTDSMLKPIKSVYIDLPYIQDIYLGSLILQHLNENDYKYIYSRLGHYKKRWRLTHANYFPELNHSEENLISYMKRPENAGAIIFTSPMTSLFLNLTNFHRDMVDHTRKVSPENEQPIIRYVINVYPLNPSDKELKVLNDRIKMIAPNIIVGFVKKPLKELQPSLFTDNQIWFVYDFTQLTDLDTPAGNHFFQLDSFANCMVFSPKRMGNPLLEDEFDNLTPKELEQLCIDTATVLNVYSDFFFLDIDLKTE